MTAGLRSNNFRIIDAARVPTGPSEPNVPRNLAFALVLGVISGVGLAFLLENMDNTVRTPEQAQHLRPAISRHDSARVEIRAATADGKRLV